MVFYHGLTILFMRSLHSILAFLRCPICKSILDQHSNIWTCTKCLTRFPLKDGIPILIHEKNSVFHIQDFMLKNETFFPKSSSFENFIKKILPNLGKNMRAKQNYKDLSNLLLKQMMLHARSTW